MSVIQENRIDVSVIVPMFNVENLISETINCLKNNCCSLEVLLINDGSTDGTLEKAKAAIGNDKRFRLINKKNGGVSTARNLGLARAKGKYISFVDSDDLVPDYAIDKLYKAALEQRSDLVYGEVRRFNNHKEWVVAAHKQFGTFTSGHKSIKTNPEMFYSIGPAGKLIHKKLLFNNRFPTGIKFGEDQAVSFSVYLNAKQIYCISECVYMYRERDLDDHAPSATQQKDIKAFLYLQNILHIVDQNKNLIKNSNLSTLDKRRVLKGYYERVLKHEIWPLFFKTLKFDRHNTGKALDIVAEFVRKHSHEYIDSVPAIRYFFLRVFIDNIFYIPTRFFLEYRNLLNSIIDGLSDKTKLYCSRDNSYGKRWEDNEYLAKEPKYKAFMYFLFLSKKKKINSYINKNKMRYIQNYLFPVFKILPKSKNKVIFATSKPGKMSSNFEYILNGLKSTEERFVVKKFLGVSNLFKRNLSRYYHLATAGTIFLEDYYRPLYGLQLSKKTKVVQLWHACGAFKKFGFNALNKQDSNTFDFEKKAHSSYTHILASSPTVGHHYEEAFGTKKKQLLPFGVPRTDLFFNNIKKAKAAQEILSQYPKLQTGVNILYAPTFRGSPTERKSFILPFQWEILDKMPFGFRLIIKLHPVVDETKLKVPVKYRDRVLILNSKADVNRWMIFCDLLVTDYSSLIFEYSLLDKPLVLYPYDLKSYFDERGFYYPYEEYAFGPIATNENELIKALINSQENNLDYVEQRIKFRNKFMSSCTGNVTQKIIEHIIKGK